jgi:hypothetical protein
VKVLSGLGVLLLFEGDSGKFLRESLVTRTEVRSNRKRFSCIVPVAEMRECRPKVEVEFRRMRDLWVTQAHKVLPLLL